VPDDDPKRLRRFSIALLGGLRLQGKPRLGDRLTRIAVIGGMDLDLAGAEFVGGKLTIVKVSPNSKRAARTSMGRCRNFRWRTCRNSSSAWDDTTSCWRTLCSRISLQAPCAIKAATSTLVSSRSLTTRA